MNTINNTERTNYWMIRTDGGRYFSEFYNNGYIGIAWNDFIDIEDIKKISLKELRQKVKEHYGETEKKPGGAATQIQTFVSIMKEGDVVLIPGYSSRTIGFGRIVSEPYVVPKQPKEKCVFRKRRDIVWFGHYSKNKLDPNLFALLNSHRAITNANPYAAFINRMLFPFYVAGETAHLTLEVITEEPILLKQILTIMNGLTELACNYEACTGEKIDLDVIQIRASFNSPGPLELIGPKKPLIWILIALHFICGGNLEVLGIKINTPGIITQAKEYFTEQKRLELQELEIKMKYATEKKIKIPSPEIVNLNTKDSL
ncbi:restriction endonuclease [Sporomusa acidovorans]|uniref:Uncharacterized protein n=1 Tax=Sporomusa acidovorans (strain ATCC 49682 / DSM 3132 / Mol) TaxID=1123286 RepID=A0ABZ3J882_SPOA4|nr:hypothetical protein [Sporomusa acidovorans]OZC15992.1 hypothetical protein SPACI_43580 [Sporomusa acidovorans DSM 3132]SDD90642.1 hypothetical protein SAMN04488499_1005139 [Sporomusa acidovorans]